MKQFNLLFYLKSNCFRSFFGRIEDTKEHFDLYLVILGPIRLLIFEKKIPPKYVHGYQGPKLIRNFRVCDETTKYIRAWRYLLVGIALTFMQKDREKLEERAKPQINDLFRRQNLTDSSRGFVIVSSSIYLCLPIEDKLCSAGELELLCINIFI